MEAVLHTMYVVAIKDSSAWEDDSPAEVSMIGFWNLVVVWLKVSLPSLPQCSSSCVAPYTMAIFPPLESIRRPRPTGKYGPMRRQQLFHFGFLAFMASII